MDSLGVQADSEFALSNDNSLDPDRINDLVQKILTAKEPMSLEQIRTEFLEGAGTDASEDVNDAIGNIVTFLRSLKEPDPRANTYDHIQLKLSTDEAVDEPEEPSDDAATAPDPLDAMSQQDFANALAGNSIGQAQKGTESGPQPNETPENPKPDTVSPEELAEVLNSTRIQAPKTTTQSS